MRRVHPLVVIAGAGCVLAVVLALDLIPFLRGGFGWQWQYAPAPAARSAVLVALTLVYLVVAFRLRRRAAALIAWSLLSVVVLTLAVVWLREDDLVRALFLRTASGVTTGGHFAAARIDWAASGRYDWPQVMLDFIGRSGHISVSPPGMPVWYAALNDTLASLPAPTLDALRRPFYPYQCHNYAMLAYPPATWASAWFGVLMPVWAALAVVPLYALTRRIAGTHAARLAVVWYPLFPTLLAFSPTWNTLYPLFSLSAFLAFHLGVEADTPRRRAGWLVAAGLLSGLFAFINLAYLVWLAIPGFYTLIRTYVRREPFTAALRVGAWMALGFFAVWAVYYAWSGLTLLDLFRATLDEHLALSRPYLPWVWLHLWDWILWTGLPVILLWIGGIVVWWRTRGQTPAAVPVLALALLLTIVILDLSGTARGESGRVWTVFTPFAFVAAADGWRRLTDRDGEPVRETAAVTLAQAAVMLVLTTTLFVISAPDLTDPPGSAAAAASAGADGRQATVTTTRAANARFAPGFRLVGWDAVYDAAAQALVVRLDWQTDDPLYTPYWFSALVVQPDGTPLAQAHVWQPLDTRYPATCWRAGETVSDTVTLSLPANAPPGDYWISLAAFADAAQPDARVTVTLPDGAPDTQIGLGPVTAAPRRGVTPLPLAQPSTVDRHTPPLPLSPASTR